MNLFGEIRRSTRTLRDLYLHDHGVVEEESPEKLMVRENYTSAINFLSFLGFAPLFLGGSNQDREVQ